MTITYSDVVSWQTYFDTTYIFNEMNGLVYQLQGTAQALWLTLEKTPDFSTVINILSQHYPSVPHANLESDMVSFVQNMQDKGLVKVLVEGQI